MFSHTTVEQKNFRWYIKERETLQAVILVVFYAYIFVVGIYNPVNSNEEKLETILIYGKCQKNSSLRGCIISAFQRDLFYQAKCFGNRQVI